MATSKLQRKFGDLLDINFPQYRIRENYRPDWLISSDDTWLELDFYIEDLKIAYEVQGPACCRIRKTVMRQAGATQLVM